MAGKGFDDARVAASLAGIIGGLAMAAALMLHSASQGEGLFHPLQGIASFWLGPEAFSAGSKALLIGAGTLLAGSFGMGGPLGWTTGRNDSVAAGLLSGLLLGATLWVLMTFAVAPSINETTSTWVAERPGWLWLGVHLLYGAVTGVLTPPIDRMIRG